MKNLTKRKMNDAANLAIVTFFRSFSRADHLAHLPGGALGKQSWVASSSSVDLVHNFLAIPAFPTRASALPRWRYSRPGHHLGPCDRRSIRDQIHRRSQTPAVPRTTRWPRWMANHGFLDVRPSIRWAGNSWRRPISDPAGHVGGDRLTP